MTVEVDEISSFSLVNGFLYVKNKLKHGHLLSFDSFQASKLFLMRKIMNSKLYMLHLNSTTRKRKKTSKELLHVIFLFLCNILATVNFYPRMLLIMFTN